MLWVYLAPHLDDVSFSCGGLLWEQARTGENVEVWTVCAADISKFPLSNFAQSMHGSWGTGAETPALRREEDKRACVALGALARHLEFPDCIYRVHPDSGEALYQSSAAVFGGLHPVERETLVEAVAARLRDSVPSQAALVVPVTLGNHVDHQLVRAAAERLGRPLLYYADYPYVIKNELQLGYLIPKGSKGRVYPVSDDGLSAWQKSVNCYKSQLSTFWPEKGSLEAAFRAYWGKLRGIQLWTTGP